MSKSESYVITLQQQILESGLFKQILHKGLPLLIGLVLTSFLGEVTVRVLFRQSMNFDMEMWKYATEVKIASDNPRLGHEHRPNRRAFLMGVEVTTNRFGLRGRETTLQKPANTYRIIALGDSITMGWGVRQEETFTAKLERMLNAEPPDGFAKGIRYEVLNFGVGNYNTVQEVEALRHLGLRFDPDLILLGYFINDAEPISKPQPNILIEHSYLYAFMKSGARRLFGNSTLANYQEYYRSLYSPGQPGWAAAQAALAELVQLGRETRIPVVMYIIPELHVLNAKYPFLDIHQTIMKLGADLGLPVLDLSPGFMGYSPEEKLWVSPMDAHPNGLANSIIARQMYNSLTAGLVKHLTCELLVSRNNRRGLTKALSDLTIHFIE